MHYLPRIIHQSLRDALGRGKSVLLLGARQTGKTTLIEYEIKPDVSYNFARAELRQRYEKDLGLFESELEQRIKSFKQKPIVFIDEVQKIPRVMDVVQHLIDRQLAQFILSASSAHKLKHGSSINLLPGRVVVLHMTPLLYSEMGSFNPSLADLLIYGS
jgi:predicted AAA+ superfamily ATPase